MPCLLTRLYEGQPEHGISSWMPYLRGGMFCALPVHVKDAIIWLQSPDDYVPSVLYSNIFLRVKEAAEERFYEAFWVYFTQPNCFLLWQCFGQNLIFIVMCMFVSSQRFWVETSSKLCEYELITWQKAAYNPFFSSLKRNMFIFFISLNKWWFF